MSVAPTTITDMLQVDVPLIQGGMAWVSGHSLAAAVSEAGALGVIGAACMDDVELREEIRALRKLTNRPFAVNVPLINVRPDSADDAAAHLMKVVLEEGVAIVITSAGSPSVWTNRIHETGARVLHVVPSPVLARKCEAAGVDAIIAEGNEAGGHIHAQGLSTFTLVPQVVDSVSIPVVAAGGIADHRGVAAAQALGASGVQVGTRFICTIECNAHEAFKQSILEAGSGGTGIYSPRLHASRALKTPAVITMINMEQDGATIEELRDFRGRDRARLGCVLGDTQEGILPSGSGVGLVNEIMSAGSVVHELARGFETLT